MNEYLDDVAPYGVFNYNLETTESDGLTHEVRTYEDGDVLEYVTYREGSKFIRDTIFNGVIQLIEYFV